MSNNILVMAAGRRVYVVRELVQAAPPGATVHVSDLDPWAAALYVDGAVPVAQDLRLEDPDAWLEATCRQHQISAVLSLHDYEGYWLAQRQVSLGEAGTLLIGPDLSTARTLIDKAMLNDHLLRHAPDLAIPTYLWDGRGTCPVGLDSGPPWMVKDRYGSASSGLRVCADLTSVAEACAENAQRIGWHPESGTAPVESVVQAYLTGTEYNVDLFFDREGTIRGHSVKAKHRMRGGETEAARVFREAPPDVLDAATRATQGLSLMGNVDIDVLRSRSGQLAVLDMNPRFGGGYAFSQKAGYQVASAVWSLVVGSPHPWPIVVRQDLCAVKHLEVGLVPMMQVGDDA